MTEVLRTPRDYATLDDNDETQTVFGVRVPLSGSNGWQITYFEKKGEALELIHELNKAYNAGHSTGWDGCYRLFKVPSSTPKEF